MEGKNEREKNRIQGTDGMDRRESTASTVWTEKGDRDDMLN